MNDIRDEDDQVRMLKQWWADNGSSLMSAALIAIAAVLGWNYWQTSQENNAINSAVAYDKFTSALAVAEQSKEDIDIAQADMMAEEIKQEFGGSGYVLFAAMFKARQAVLDEDYALAISELEWVKENDKQGKLLPIVNLRLARVLLLQDDIEGAQAIADSQIPKAFQPLYDELSGDIAIKQGDYQKAVSLYDQSKLALESRGDRASVVALKADSARTKL